MSGIRPADCSKLSINWKNDNDVTICWDDVIVKFSWGCLFFLVKFSCWSKFHVNIINGSGVMTIFFYKRLTRSRETTVWILPNIWRLGRVKDTKFDTNVSNKMALKAAKYQCYSFYHFWVKKGKPTGVVKLPPTQMRVKLRNTMEMWPVSGILGSLTFLFPGSLLPHRSAWTTSLRQIWHFSAALCSLCNTSLSSWDAVQMLRTGALPSLPPYWL